MTEWLSRLVRIPSVSPDQAGGRTEVAGEGRLAGEVAKWFGEFGGQVHAEVVVPGEEGQAPFFAEGKPGREKRCQSLGEVHTEEVLSGRPNVYGLWRGESDRWVAVDVHTDTVGVEQMSDDPFSGRIADGRVYGRGSVDTKASLAVALALLEEMHRAGRRPRDNLLIAATCDEEIGGRGARAFARWVRERNLSLDQLLVAEPTLCGPVHGHKGVSRVRFEIEGRSAHSSQPERGRNAVCAAGHLVLALEEEGRRLLATPPKTVLGPATLTVSMIQGGRGINVVPDSCQVSIDRRVVAGEKPSEVTASLGDLARRSCPLPVAAEVLLETSAFLQSADTAWIRRLAEWSGIEPTTVDYGTNAWAYDGLAGECVILGPGSIEQAHRDEEWVAISELEKLAGIYSRWWGLGL